MQICQKSYTLVYSYLKQKNGEGLKNIAQAIYFLMYLYIRRGFFLYHKLRYSRPLRKASKKGFYMAVQLRPFRKNYLCFELFFPYPTAKVPNAIKLQGGGGGLGLNGTTIKENLILQLPLIR